MIISEKYGPQLDPVDGTCGRTKLVKRYVLVSGPGGEMWGPSQGRCTHASEALAKRALSSIKSSNTPDRYPSDLRVAPRWCWPGHFDPACRVEEPPDNPPAAKEVT